MEGDVVTAINREKVHSIEELKAALNKVKDGVITMNVMREGSMIFLVIQ